MNNLMMNDLLLRSCARRISDQLRWLIAWPRLWSKIFGDRQVFGITWLETRQLNWWRLIGPHRDRLNCSHWDWAWFDWLHRSRTLVDRWLFDVDRLVNRLVHRLIDWLIDWNNNRLLIADTIIIQRLWRLADISRLFRLKHAERGTIRCR